MTAVFAMIKNSTAQPITVVKADVQRDGVSIASMIQLHEMVMINGVSQMQQKKDGFTIPAGGTLELKPGGFHIMIMGLTAPVKAGDSLDVTLTTSTGTTIAFKAMGKDFAGGNEKYNPSGSASAGMPSMADPTSSM
jgi:hypothetical protein